MFKVLDLNLLKVKDNILVGQLIVYGGVTGDTSFYVCLILRIKVDLMSTRSIDLMPDSLSLDFSGVNNIIQNSILYGSQCSATRSDSLGLGSPGKRLSKNGALSNEKHVGSRELLL